MLRLSQWKIFIILGIAGALFGLGQYYRQETIASDLLYQFQNAPIKSLKIILFTNNEQRHSSPWLEELEVFLKKSQALTNGKKASVLAVLSPDITEQESKTLIALTQAYPNSLSLSSEQELFAAKSLSGIPESIQTHWDPQLRESFLKLWLLDTPADTLIIADAEVFPIVYHPQLCKNHLLNALNSTQIYGAGLIFNHCYLPQKYPGSKKIFLIDQDVMMRCFNTPTTKTLWFLCLQRLKQAQAIIEHEQNLHTEAFKSPEEYNTSLQGVLEAYSMNPQLFIGSENLKKWVIGSIFYDEMHVEYKNLFIIPQIAPVMPESKNPFIFEGVWSPTLAQSYLKQQDTSALVRAALLSHDMKILETQSPLRESVQAAYDTQYSALSLEERLIVDEICAKNTPGGSASA